MKKFLVIAISALMITTVVGCSSKDNNPKNEQGSNVEENVGFDDLKYFGKVNNVVGNEIELEIANREIIGAVDEETGEESEGEMMPAATMTPATTGENNEASVGDANKDKIVMEYTGEIENIVIPGGATIIDLTTGKDGKISDIKDGSVIVVYTNSTSGSISKIEIME